MDFNERMEKIDSFFNPESVAVVGATTSAFTAGWMVMNNLFKGDGRGHHFTGNIYLINKRMNGERINGLPTYPSLRDIPAKKIDLGIIMVPAKFVKEVITQLGELKAECATIITAGFSEMQSYNESSVDHQQEIVDEARKYGIRLVGPNCNGLYSSSTYMNCVFGPGIKMFSGPDAPHGVSLVSKGGTAGIYTMVGAALRGFVIDKFIAIGDECDLTIQDIIEYYNWDTDTKVIAVYSEGITDARRFIDIMKKVKKPVVIYKSGQSEYGRRAALSHVGAISSQNSARLFDGFARQAGLIRAESLEEMIETCQFLIKIPAVPKGKNVCILTPGGSIGVMQSDACEKAGLKLPALKKNQIDLLNEILPPYWSHNNPIDITDAGMDPSIMRKCLDIVLKDPDIDGAFLIGMIPNTDPEIVDMKVNEDSTGFIKMYVESQVSYVKEMVGKYGKPVLLVSQNLDVGARSIMEKGIPVVHSFNIAAQVFTITSDYDIRMKAIGA